jgi:hypothetical protein
MLLGIARSLRILRILHDRLVTEQWAAAAAATLRLLHLLASFDLVDEQVQTAASVAASVAVSAVYGHDVNNCVPSHWHRSQCVTIPCWYATAIVQLSASFITSGSSCSFRGAKLCS